MNTLIRVFPFSERPCWKSRPVCIKCRFFLHIWKVTKKWLTFRMKEQCYFAFVGNLWIYCYLSTRLLLHLFQGNFVSLKTLLLQHDQQTYLLHITLRGKIHMMMIQIHLQEYDEAGQLTNCNWQIWPWIILCLLVVNDMTLASCNILLKRDKQFCIEESLWNWVLGFMSQRHKWYYQH